MSAYVEMKGLDLRSQNSYISRNVFRLMSKAMAAGAAGWFILCCWAGLEAQALLPLAYLVLTGVNLYVARKAQNTGLPALCQMFFSITVPFMMQAMLGGIQSSGLIMFWSFSALCGALTYRRLYMILMWSALELVCLVSCILLDPRWVIGEPVPLHALPSFNVLLAINILGPMFIILGVAYHFVRIQGQVRKHNHEMKLVLAETNARMEQRNMEMEQSLRYARTIQQALLPDMACCPKEITAGLVLYRPKDHVGGDLFWKGSSGDHHLIAVMDCTGHGVPGALLTVIVHNLLNEVVLLRHTTDPKRVVEEVVNRLPLVLNRPAGTNQDGVELSVVRIDHAAGDHRFAGFGLSLLVVNGDTGTVLGGGNSLLNADVGLRTDSVKDGPLQLAPGAKLYAFTDGFGHQFGGDDGRKFSRTRLQQALLAMSALPWDEQQRSLERTLDQWKGDQDQVDDILVLGFEPVLCAKAEALRCA